MKHVIVAATAALVSHGAIAAEQRNPQIKDGAEAQAIRDAAIVREAQEKLRAHGYAATPQGLKEFQQAKGIAPSGKLDQRTLAALGVVDPPASGDSAPKN